MKIFLLMALLSPIVSLPSFSQNVAVKTNLLYDATQSVNLGIEAALAPQWTLDISGDFNDWTLSHSRRWKHWLAQPEARYWFCQRFAGHFLGIHAHGGQYNVGGFNGIYNMLGSNLTKIADGRYQGWFLGAGAAYGYAWMLGRHWNLEAEIGVGYAYTRFDVYPCGECGSKTVSDKSHHYVGPTKAAVNLVYVF